MAPPIYSLRIAEVFEALGSSPDGVSAEEAQSRLSLYGGNILVEQPKTSLWKRIAAHILHPMAFLLWGAGMLALLGGEIFLAAIVWSIILVNAAFSYWQEYRAEQALEALRRLLPDYTRVIRSGSEILIPASQIVPGDVLVLAEGDHISADSRVVESYGLRTNNANLTGEAVPARKYADASLRDDIVELERPNLVFAGTSVVSGTGRAVVFSTGMLTQFGRIAHLTQAVTEEPGHSHQEIRKVTRRLSWVAFGLGALVFGFAWLDFGFELRESLMLALGVLAAAVPEGLPATVTITLAFAAQRLARRGVLVKKLSKIETLGGISLICTDKSGTLTQNQMTVREIWVGGNRFHVSGVGYEPEGKFKPEPGGTAAQVELKALLSAAGLCNNARLLHPTRENTRWTSLGDQTEAALKVVMIKYGLSEDSLEQAFPRLHELPFEARRKRMSTVHRCMASPNGVLFPPQPMDMPEINSQQRCEIALVKGAPKEVFQLCKHILIEGRVQILDEGMRSKILAATDDYARNALRVLAFGYRILPPKAGAYTIEKVETNLVFLGLMAMMDPPRPEVMQTVRACRGAGIRMVMITGDYGLTAESVARRIGMLESNNPLLVTGADLETMTDDELLALASEEVIFARMAPEHKLRLVDMYQKRGEVVAVTGDGVNDAPALRKADVGIVMGLAGTDVAKEAADIIITNDNFYSIVAAIEEGRAIYDNLRKFITYIFSSNVPEILPFILAGLFDIPPALTVLQVLAIDLGTDLLPALALGAEKPEPDVLNRPPRHMDKPVIDRHLLRRSFLWLGLIEAVLAFIGFFAVYSITGVINLADLFSLDIQAVAADMWDAPAWVHPLSVLVYFSGVIIAQVGNAFACRSENHRGRHIGWLSNPFLITGVAVEIALFIAVFLYNQYGPRPLPIILWASMIIYAPGLYTLDWLRKQWVRRRAAKRAELEES